MIKTIMPHKINCNSDMHTKRTFIDVFGHGRGSITRAKIIRLISDSPKNTLEIAKELDMDYKTIQHNLEVLKKYYLINNTGRKYGAIYFSSPLFEENLQLFSKVANMLEIIEHQKIIR